MSDKPNINDYAKALDKLNAVSKERDALKADKEILDWLEKHVVEVRKPALHGCRAYFFAQDLSDENEEYRNNIRAAVREAMKEEQMSAVFSRKGLESISVPECPLAVSPKAQ